MDRKIKFRGKRIDNGQWVYGYLCFIYIDTDKARIYSPELVGSYDVYLETVGQYIEENDKNNNELYENDLVLYRNKTWQIVFIDSAFLLKDLYSKCTEYLKHEYIHWRKTEKVEK